MTTGTAPTTTGTLASEEGAASGVAASGVPASGVAASGVAASGVPASAGVAASGVPASAGVAASGVPASGVAASGVAAAGQPRVAVLDRDSGFIQVLAKRMERLGWEHRLLASPVPADALASMRLSALVVDLTVLGSQAWEWLERVCGALPELGVIVCTGPSTVAQRVRGLRLGADDWVSKPCHPEEVIARVEVLARRRRRSAARAERKPLSAGEVEIRADRFQAYVRGRSLELTRREFELIELLAGAEGRVLEREEIYSRLWGYSMVRGDRSVDVFVRKLRQKLERSSPDWRYIHTHFGIGYRFAAEPLDGADPRLAARELAARGIAQAGQSAAVPAGQDVAPARGAGAVPAGRHVAPAREAGAAAVCQDGNDERDGLQRDAIPA